MCIRDRGGVVLVQREGAGGGFNGDIGGAAGGISDAVQGKAVPPVSYTHLDVYKRQGGGHPEH